MPTDMQLFLGMMISYVSSGETFNGKLSITGTVN